jgi:hypothetical protein
MSDPRARELPAEDVALAIDTERAQTLLHDIAVELRFLGLEGHAAPLHVRALDLKRDVTLWTETSPTEMQRQSTIDELLALHERVKAVRRGQR